MFSTLEQCGEPLSTPRPISNGGFLGHPVVGLALSELDQGRLLAFLAANVGGPEALRRGWNRPLSDIMLSQALPHSPFEPCCLRPRKRRK
jgi:hypothetical protein